MLDLVENAKLQIGEESQEDIFRLNTYLQGFFARQIKQSQSQAEEDQDQDHITSLTEMFRKQSTDYFHSLF